MRAAELGFASSASVEFDPRARGCLLEDPGETLIQSDANVNARIRLPSRANARRSGRVSRSSSGSPLQSVCLSRSAVRRRKARARRCSSSLLPEKRRWMRLVLARACREVRRAVLTCESAKLWREGRRLEGTFRNSDSPTLSTKETKHGAHSQTQTNGRSFRVNPHRLNPQFTPYFQTRILWLNEMPTVDQKLNVATNSCAVEP